MAVKIHLWTDEYLCSSCGAVVDENAEKCPKCGESFESTEEEDKVLKIEISEEKQDETSEALRIFSVMMGASFNAEYVDDIKKEIENSPFSRSILAIFNVLMYYHNKISSIDGEIEELIKRMKKERKDEILRDLDELKNINEKKAKLWSHLGDIYDGYREALKNYENFLLSREKKLNARIKEFQKELERRKKQAKMLIEKEKELLEREHRLREREKMLEGRIKDIETVQKKLEQEGITKEEWLEEQKKIQEKLYQIREEVVTRRENERERLTKEVLKILDDLLGKLPDEVIDEFARSKNFDLYKKVMMMYGLGGGSGAS